MSTSPRTNRHHAKNAKDAKACIEENTDHEIQCLRALLAILARFA
jgi:hypothetical protein